MPFITQQEMKKMAERVRRHLRQAGVLSDLLEAPEEADALPHN